MENEILEIIKKMIYIDYENEAYENRYKKIDFPITINMIPNYKVISDFNELYFEKYKGILLTNSVVYAIENNKIEYLNFIKKYISDLNKVLNDINLFRGKTTEFAILNIVSKSKKFNNSILFNSELNSETLNNNKKLFNEINKNFISYTSITNYYKNILLDFLNQFDNLNRDIILDKFLTTNEIDKKFIEFSKNKISINKINLYKYFIIRNILSDNYLSITTCRIEDELDNYLNNINRSSDDIDYEYEIEEDEFDKFEKEIDDKICKHIDYCISRNKYLLPQDDTLRYNMYVSFLSYNELDSKEYDIETVEGSPKDLKKLKLINPFYKLDLIK